MDFASIILVVIALAVLYKLGLFRPIINFANVATRESDKYDRDHKAKVGRSYLGNSYTFTEDETSKINANIKAIDSLKFD